MSNYQNFKDVDRITTRHVRQKMRDLVPAVRPSSEPTFKELYDFINTYKYKWSDIGIPYTNTDTSLSFEDQLSTKLSMYNTGNLLDQDLDKVSISDYNIRTINTLIHSDISITTIAKAYRLSLSQSEEPEIETVISRDEKTVLIRNKMEALGYNPKKIYASDIYEAVHLKGITYSELGLSDAIMDYNETKKKIYAYIKEDFCTNKWIHNIEPNRLFLNLVLDLDDYGISVESICIYKRRTRVIRDIDNKILNKTYTPILKIDEVENTVTPIQEDEIKNETNHISYYKSTVPKIISDTYNPAILVHSNKYGIYINVTQYFIKLKNIDLVVPLVPDVVEGGIKVILYKALGLYADIKHITYNKMPGMFAGWLDEENSEIIRKEIIKLI